MLKTENPRTLNTVRNYNDLLLNVNPLSEPVAIYAYGQDHQQMTSMAQPQPVKPTEQTLYKKAKRSRYKFLPDGSIVDFGLRIRNDNPRHTDMRTDAMPIGQPRASMASPTVWSPTAHSTSTGHLLSTGQFSSTGQLTSAKQMTSTGQIHSNQHLVHAGQFGPSGQLNSANQLTSTDAQLTSSAQLTSTSHTMDSLAIRPLPVWPEPSTAAQPFAAPTMNSTISFPTTKRRRPANAGIPIGHLKIDDSLNHLLDDLKRSGKQKTDDFKAHSTKQPVDIPQLPLKSDYFTTQVAGLNFTIRPTSTTRRKTTTRFTTTTTLPPTTTTPKPTQHPDDVYFYSQGGGKTFSPLLFTTILHCFKDLVFA